MSTISDDDISEVDRLFQDVEVMVRDPLVRREVSARLGLGTLARVANSSKVQFSVDGNSSDEWRFRGNIKQLMALRYERANKCSDNNIR